MMNKLIRDMIKNKRLKQWQVADMLGISEATFVRRMRHELPDAEREHILKVIDDMEVERHE